MKKTITTLFLLLLLFNLKAQTIGDYNNKYQLGLDNLNKGDYKMADSLISQCLNQFNPLSIFLIDVYGLSTPINNIYFNHAIVKLGLNDTCSYCSEMHNASIYNDNEAFNYYINFCLKSIDSTYFDKKYSQTTKDKARYITIKYFDKYANKYFGRVLDTKVKEKKNIVVKVINFGNIIGLFRIENNDTIFTKLVGYSFIPKFKKWNNDYYGYVESILSYPEDKNLAYQKYNCNTLNVDYKVIIVENGIAGRIELEKTTPSNLDKIYIDEALKAVNQILGYIKPGNILGKNVKTEVLIPIVFNLKH